MITLLLVLVVILAIIFVPLLAIWSLNTLFLLAIPYTIKTWAAALALSAMIGGSTGGSSK